jgi:hypothetical protein
MAELGDDHAPSRPGVPTGADLPSLETMAIRFSSSFGERCLPNRVHGVYQMM